MPPKNKQPLKLRIREHIPNSLTVLRLILSFVVIILLSASHFNLALIVFLVSILTDWLDGYLARKWSVKSSFGERYDPLVDKFLVLLPLLYFTYQYNINLLYFLVILVRELVITLVREKEYNAGRAMPADVYGKIKTNLQFGLVLMFFGVTIWLPSVDTFLLTIVYFIVSTWTAWSGLNYLQILNIRKKT